MKYSNFEDGSIDKYTKDGTNDLASIKDPNIDIKETEDDKDVSKYIHDPDGPKEVDIPAGPYLMRGIDPGNANNADAIYTGDFPDNIKYDKDTTKGYAEDTSENTIGRDRPDIKHDKGATKGYADDTSKNVIGRDLPDIKYDGNDDYDSFTNDSNDI